jgi:glycosyltransferase involved in cell wall biosynthesis
MKIALLTEKYTPDIGGLAISTGRLGQLLSSNGDQVRVFAATPHLPPSEKRTLNPDGISVTRFGTRKRLDDTLVDWIDLIIEEHRREPFDLLQGYFLPQAGFIAAYAGKYLNIPSVVSIRGNDIERAAFDPSKFSHVMYALQNASAVTTNACELARKAKAFVDREIFVIPNGIDTELFQPREKNKELAKSLGLVGKGIKNEKTAPVIGFAGELREKKGLKSLLHAYAQINKKQPSTLLIVGEVRSGEDKQAFEQFQQAIPNSKLIVTGMISHKDMPSYYALMDVFVHPSLRDGMPNALLEAMACEKAVIATRAGGIMDVIESGKNGMLVNVNDPDTLAESILQLLSQPEKHRAISQSARQTVLHQFTLEKELEANLQVYRSLGLKI